MKNPAPRAARRRKPLNAYAPPTAPPAPERAPAKRPAPTAITRGQRVAAGLLLASAALTLLYGAALRANVIRAGHDYAKITTVLFLISLIDLTLGIFLIRGSLKTVRWALGRAAVGLLVGVVMVVAKDRAEGVVLVLASGALAALLVGEAGKLRIAVSASLWGLYALVRLADTGAEVSGRNPLAPLLQSATGEIELAPAGVVTGVSSHYRLNAASNRWHLHKPDAARKDGRAADRWLTRPDLDAHLQVYVLRKPGVLYPVDDIVDEVLQGVGDGVAAFQVVSREPLRTHPHEGRLVHSRTTVNESAFFETLRGFVSVQGHDYRMIASAPASVFPEVEAELRSMIESFELPNDEGPDPIGDIEATPVGRVEGMAAKYALTLPYGKWYLRKPEVAKKENALVDRWLVRPDKAAQILVFFEQMPEGEIDIETFTGAVLETIRESVPESQVLSQGPLRGNPNARLVHLRLRLGGEDMEQYAALFVQGGQTFRVLAFANAQVMDSVRAEILAICASFAPPASASPPP